ncbi:hypothetical protein N0V83_002675 [Neocucurbitaria cava]|uniref:Uncharacterized protein n=1 Tax=Neocucurbitaria cava TaxID=798079 RepID=A0A9W9CNX2_9PLEO|nr:hypothetical protein N0V83_002675 [Neocucurbitaria cava]
MSLLLKLPTELDAIIVEYVRYGGSSQDTLKSLCHVSKYYRQLAEPLLYQDILISNLAEHRVKRLLNALLDRKDLAKHVKRLVVQECSTSTPDSPSLSNHLANNNDATILSKAKNYMQHPPWKPVEISPYLLEKLIRSPITLRNLRSLHLSALTCSPSTPLPLPSFASGSGAWATYRYARLTALLVTYLPQLEELACFEMGTHGTVRPLTFGSLRALSKLHKLKVDFNLLVHFGTYMVSPLLPPWDATSGLLPKGVKQVHLMNAKTATLMYAWGGYGNSEHVWHFLKEPGAPVLPALEKFTVDVVRDARLQPFFLGKAVEDKMLEELEGAAERAVGRGLEYTVNDLRELPGIE